MVYRRKRKYRRPYRGKRRRYKKKRSGRRSLGFKIARKVGQLTEGSRRYFSEVRDDAIETTRNTVGWRFLPCIGSRNCIETMIQAVHENAIHSGIGESALGALDEFAKVDITSYHTVYHFRNVDEHPLSLTLFEVEARRDIASSSLDMPQYLRALVNNDWVKFKADETTAATATNKEGVDIIANEGSDQIDVYSQFLNLKQARQFNQQFKICKAKKYKLNPGDEVYWTVRVRNRVYDRSRTFLEEYATSTAIIDILKKYSRGLIARVSGMIGRSNVADEADVIGIMQTDCTVDYVTAARLQPLQSAKHEDYAIVTLDDLSAKTMVAPTEDAHTDDAN